MKVRVLRFSDRGPAVQLLQLALDRASFGPLETDGIFGLRTQEALRRFQLSRGLASDGVAGRASHEALLPWYTGYLRHRVRAGESFYSIAQLYGARPEAVELANSTLEPGNIPIGAMVTVPLPFDVVPTDIDFCSALAAYCVRGLCARYPFLSCASVGRSVLGRPLWSLTLGAGENRVLYSAAHHANEWITTPLLLSFAEELAESFAQGGMIFGQSAAELLDYARLCLVPLVDPDGLDLVTGELRRGEAFESARSIAGQYPGVPFPAGWKANIRGTDLNLQYPAGWETAREIKAAAGVRGPAPKDYVGPAPLSAPESRAMAALTRRFDPALTLAFHTQGEVIYWRYGDYEIPGARDIAATFAAVSGYSPEDTPYASGFAGYKDWFIQSFRRPGFTIECGRGVNPLPLTELSEIRRRCLGILTLGALVT
ncbi:MAG: peptidoglycan-binding protein [Oscillospiraceae bacterium]|nr:peptidoglycan-binding protein [Oscillospiraceae bacterium]